MIAIFTDLLRRAAAGRAPPTVKRARLVWMARSTGDFRLFEQIFALAAGTSAAAVARTSRMSTKTASPVPETDTDEPSEPRASAASTRADTAASDATASATESELPGTAEERPRGPVSKQASEKSNLGTTAPAKDEGPEPEIGQHGVVIGGIAFSVQLHCTKRESWVSLSDPHSLDYTRLFVHHGRCDVMSTIMQIGGGPNTIAAVCGPLSLSLDVSAVAWQLGADFHAEQFAF
eukprot:m.45947 g.45947  ORF g.45947 m.45947 type:complete len:234 (-) comp11060_c1_seq1:117-818(-)